MASISILDDRARALEFSRPPRRVVSLVPSDTYNVAALGCGGALVGCTDWCDLPKDLVARLPRVGGTKDPKIDRVCDLSPDLVLANQEENTRSDLEELQRRGLPVYIAFPKRVADGFRHLANLACMFEVARDPTVRALLQRADSELRAAQDALGRAVPLRTFCPIWMKPLMTINGDTFISDMLELCGAENIFAGRQRRYPLAADLGNAPALPPEKVGARDLRYPRVTLDEVVAHAPDVVLLPDEPHPFTEEDAAVFRGLDIPAARSGRIARAGGKDLCWYGARSVEGMARIRWLLESS